MNSDEQLPDGGYSNRAMIGAYRKGYKAAFAGEACACPYIDKRSKHGCHVTFSRAFLRAWYDGFDAGFYANKGRRRADPS